MISEEETAFYTLGMAASILQVSYETVLSWIKKGRIAATRGPLGHWRIPKDEVARIRTSYVPTRALKTGVYFVKCEGFIKIGYAADVSIRFQSFRASNPFPVSLLLFIPTADIAAAEALERSLHLQFSPKRHRGEWFVYCPEIANFIDGQSR